MNHDNDNAATNVAAGPRVLDLFSAAAGGWSLGMHRAGFHTIAACEVIDWRRALYSQNNPGVHVYDDVTTLTANRLIRDGIGLPDIIVGSPPCQDISSANTKGKGVDGERSGLYFEAVRLIDECRPRWFALENSANLRTRGADRVIDALEAIGYTCWPFVVSAGDIGANHERKRSWLVGVDARAVADSSFPVSARWHSSRGWLWCAEGDEGEWAVSILQQQPETTDGDTNSQSGTAGFCAATHERPDDERGGQFRQVAEPGGDGAFLCEDANPCETERRPDAIEGGHRVRKARERTEGTDRHAEPTEARECGEPELGQMGRREGASTIAPEPWADWNGGLAHHLRVDDGLSGWVAQSRIAVGGPRGTVAASLIVEAFGDAVCPQIPEAIGRAILRVEAALALVHTTTPNKEAARAA